MSKTSQAVKFFQDKGETRYYEYFEKHAWGAKALIENNFVYAGTPTYLSFAKWIRDVK
jgi:hypothetical protein